MNCTNCGADNAPGQRFCGECGTRLATACPSCGASNAPGQKFCGGCGSRVDSLSPAGAGAPSAGTGADGSGSHGAAAYPTAPVAERRVVSVLFADLVGFTPFAEERDSEDVRETLTRYFDLATEVVVRYGGTVEKFIGDAVMAVWGTPTAREDDAERAVRAGLDLHDAIRGLGEGIQARVGVLTGEAAVTLGATNQGMVAGDIVNTAARIQSVAPPGTVLVGETTSRAASAAIVFEEMGEQALKGKAAPVPVWRAVRVVAERGGRGRTDVLEAPFVGRDDDLRLIKELFHGTARDGRTRLVSITGIGGIGKSRLAWEFEKYMDGLVQLVWWHHGRSPAYDQGLPFWPLGEMVRGRCGLAETDDEATTRAKVAEAVATHVPDESERAWITSALLALLGVEDAYVDGRQSSPEELFAGWRTFFERLALTAPVVMVFEDLHWADPGTLDFIDHLLDWAKSIPLTIVTLARPELLERRTDWGAGRRNFVSLSLEPLPEPAMRALLAGLVPGLPGTAVQVIVARADGIPLYAVETVRMLVAERRLEERDGVYAPVGDLTDLAVPDSLTALIAARLDGLDPADRALLLDAAVLGQSFTPAGLAAVSGLDTEVLEPRLRALVRREILTLAADPRSPERGQYAFVQALIREVAYNTLAKRDRKDRHLAAARFFEALGMEELAGALAGHYLAAHELAAEGPEADALAAQARIALKAAADRAALLGSPTQAVRLLDQALLVTTAPEEQADLLERAGDLASLAADHDAAAAHLERALELVRAAGDQRLVLRVTSALVHVLLNGKRGDQAGALLDANPVPPELASTPEGASLDGQRARAAFFTEEPRKAIEIAERVLEVAEHLDLVPLLADVLVTKGSALGQLGRVREAIAVIDAGRSLAEAAGLTFIALRAMNNVGSWLSLVDIRAAMTLAREGLTLGRRLGQKGWVYAFAGNLGYYAFVVGEWDLCRKELESTLADVGDPADRGLLINNLLNLRIVRGEPHDELRSELNHIVQTLPEQSWKALLLESDGWAAFAIGDHAAANRTWREMADLSPSGAASSLVLSARAAIMARDADAAAVDVARLDALGVHGPIIEANRAEIRAGIAGLRGEHQRAFTGYREASRFWRAGELRFDEALAGLAMVRTLGPDEPDVRTAAATARSTFERLGARPLLAQLDALMAVDSSESAAPEPNSGLGTASTAGRNA